MITTIAAAPVAADSVDPSSGAAILAVVAVGALLLAGVVVLRSLAALAADPANPELHLNADGAARYERVDQVLADVARAGIHRLGLVDTQRFAGSIDH